MRCAACVLWFAIGCGPSDEADTSDPPLAGEIRIAKISLNQAVEVPLAIGGVPAAKSSPIVEGRPGLLRVMVEPDPGFTPREVTARLRMEPSGKVQTQVRTISSASVPADLETSFQFELSASELGPDAAFALSLHGEAGKSSAPPRYPRTGSAALEPQSSGAALSLVLVPARYLADGSSRLPELGAEQLARYRETLFSLYPAREVEVRLREPADFDTALSPSGEGWSDYLAWLLYVRNQDSLAGRARADEYYYGLVAPADSRAAYCGSSAVCVLGLSSASAEPDDVLTRGSVGVGFAGQDSADTLAHELGHAHGRKHSPCAPLGFIQDVDPSYPHPDGGIGVWGYDLLHAALVDPAGPHRDFMGYCAPSWVSDYTFGALFERMRAVDSAGGGGGGSLAMRLFAVDAHGVASRGRKLRVASVPRGEQRSVEILRANGQVDRQETGVFQPLTHLAGGILWLPEPRAGDRAFRFRGSTVAWENPLLSR